MQVEYWTNMKDLIVLVADKNMEFLIQGLFPRIPSVERTVQVFSFDSLVHPYRDPGIYNEADDFLRSFMDEYSYAMVILDHAGCGREEKTREEIERDIEGKLFQSGWQDRACAITIEPELENWIWVSEVRIAKAISWEDANGIYNWLHENDWKTPEELKPSHPKEAFEAALRICKTPRSSSIYRDISSQASYQQCKDPAFLKMLSQLRAWFRQ